jgi:hypothetical protein
VTQDNSGATTRRQAKAKRSGMVAPASEMFVKLPIPADQPGYPTHRATSQGLPGLTDTSAVKRTSIREEVGFGTMYFRSLTTLQWHFSVGSLAIGLAFLST